MESNAYTVYQKKEELTQSTTAYVHGNINGDICQTKKLLAF